jgi:hypothetical protein
VVWQGSAGDRRPYADQVAMWETAHHWKIKSHLWTKTQPKTGKKLGNAKNLKLLSDYA